MATLHLYHVELPVGNQFKDPDAADQVAGKLTYQITSSRDERACSGWWFVQDREVQGLGGHPPRSAVTTTSH